MNRINGYVTQHAESYEYYIEWEEFNVNQQANTSSVRATSYIKCNAHTSYQNNNAQNLWIAGRQFSNTLNINLSPGTIVALVSGTVDNIPHNWDGSLNIEIDLNKQNTEEDFTQAYYKIIKSSSGYPSLTQTDIINNNGIYQFELARFRTDKFHYYL